MNAYPLALLPNEVADLPTEFLVMALVGATTGDPKLYDLGQCHPDKFQESLHAVKVRWCLGKNDFTKEIPSEGDDSEIRKITIKIKAKYKNQT